MVTDHDDLPVLANIPPQPGIWDGKNLAAIQVATAIVPRFYGRPCAEVDPYWNLTLHGEPVEVGDTIMICEHGLVTVHSHRTGQDRRVPARTP
jgi:hypothetical protein